MMSTGRQPGEWQRDEVNDIMFLTQASLEQNNTSVLTSRRRSVGHVSAWWRTKVGRYVFGLSVYPLFVNIYSVAQKWHHICTL